MYIENDIMPRLERIEIPLRDDLMQISEEMDFTYREVWVMSLFVRRDRLESALLCVRAFDTTVEEYLISVKSAPAEIISDLLHCDAHIYNPGD